MSFFRSLLWWLLLAALGALAWGLLSHDPGAVLIQWRDRTITTTVAFGLVAWGVLWFLLWGFWRLLRLPFAAWQRLAQRQARHRLINGLTALHEGRYGRAENLLAMAATDPAARTVALLAARKAALRRGDFLAAATHQAALAEHDPLAAGLNTAELLLAQRKSQQALEQLQPYADRKILPPRGQRLYGEALIAQGRAAEAVERIPNLRNEAALSADSLAALERRWLAASLHQATNADELHRRWNLLSLPLREQADVVSAFAERASALGLETEAAQALADAIDLHWHDVLAHQFGLLAPGRDDQRLVRAERWGDNQANNPALNLCLGRLNRRAQRLGKADECLHRAIAQGAGSEAWEELGHLYTTQNDSTRAPICYANALRVGRGEAALALTGRTLREQIADQATTEVRNEHGMPLLHQ